MFPSGKVYHAPAVADPGRGGARGPGVAADISGRTMATIYSGWPRYLRLFHHVSLFTGPGEHHDAHGRNVGRGVFHYPGTGGGVIALPGGGEQPWGHPWARSGASAVAEFLVVAVVSGGIRLLDVSGQYQIVLPDSPTCLWWESLSFAW